MNRNNKKNLNKTNSNKKLLKSSKKRKIY